MTDTMLPNEELSDHLHWCAKKIGVHLIALCPEPRFGFREVKTKDNPKDFYGVVPTPEFDCKDLHTEISQDEAIRRKLLRGYGFIDNFWERMVSIARDKYERTRDQRNIRAYGGQFYNGELARFRGLEITQGKGDFDPILEIEIGRTSHFTSVATTQTINGYTYQYTKSKANETPLDPALRWIRSDWRKNIKKSYLADTLSIQLMLYNEYEILYVRRGKVGIAEGLLDSTVNGVIEFSTSANEREAVEKDPVGHTSQKETLEELHVDIDPKKIRWLACGVTESENRVSLLGMCRIDKRAHEVRAMKNLLRKVEKLRNSNG